MPGPRLFLIRLVLTGILLALPTAVRAADQVFTSLDAWDMLALLPFQDSTPDSTAPNAWVAGAATLTFRQKLQEAGLRLAETRLVHTLLDDPEWLKAGGFEPQHLPVTARRLGAAALMAGTAGLIPDRKKGLRCRLAVRVIRATDGEILAAAAGECGPEPAHVMDLFDQTARQLVSQLPPEEQQALEQTLAVRLTDSPDALRTLGLGYAAERHRAFRQALAHFRQALQLDPGCAEAHYHLGICLRAAGDLAAAGDQFQRALQARSPYPEAAVALGNAWLARERPDEAESAYNQAQETDPPPPGSDLGLGAVCLFRRDIPGALAAYGRVRKANPQDWDAAIGLAAAHDLAGRVREARAAFQAYLDLAPASATTAGNRKHAAARLKSLSRL